MKKEIILSLIIGLVTASLGTFIVLTTIEQPILIREGEIFQSYTIQFHVDVWMKRAENDEIIYLGHHAGVATLIGLNWIEDQLGDSPSTDPSKWISLSDSSSSPSSAWTIIPSEIVANGLTRASGTYASTGDGTWTITKVFTCDTAPQSARLMGLNYASSGDNNLLFADTFTVASLQINDTLTITATLGVS